MAVFLSFIIDYYRLNSVKVISDDTFGNRTLKIL